MMMRRTRPTCGSLVRLGLLSSVLLAGADTARGQQLQLVLQDLDTPTFVTSWPGNADLLVVAERGIPAVTAYSMTAGPPPVPPPGGGGRRSN